MLIKNDQSIILFVLISLIYCGCFIHHKRYVMVPEDDFKLDQKKLRSDGYYYTEHIRDAWCKSPPIIFTKEEIEAAKYDCAVISYFILYEDGYLYNEGYSISGLKLTHENDDDHCDLLATQNNFESARSNL